MVPGFLLGTRQTLLETLDGGKTWEARDIEAAKDEGFNYRFNRHVMWLVRIQACGWARFRLSVHFFFCMQHVRDGRGSFHKLAQQAQDRLSWNMKA